jgi:type VI secretion system protein ImpA
MPDLQALLAAVSPAEPAGPNLEYDGAFASLDRAAQGKAEQQLGNAVVAAEPPDWKEVAKQSQALLARTKDLRVAVLYAKSRLRLDGLRGLADGLALLRGLLDAFWEVVHPQLDPEEGNDPTMRVTALMGICDADTLATLRTTPLVAARRLGKFTLRDVALANNELTLPPGSTEKAPTMTTIDAAFTEADPAIVAATTAAVRQSIEDAKAIENRVLEQVGGSKAVDLSKLTQLLSAALKVLARHDGAGAGAGAGAGDGAGAAAEAGGSDGAAGGGALTGDVRSRDDVLRALDRICGYYERNEPSSPVPLLMKRAKRLVTMNFLSIMKDIAPDAMPHVESLTGRSGDSDGGGSPPA